MRGNSSVKRSLGFLVAIGLLALIAVTAAGVVGLRHVNAMLDEVGTVRLPSILGLEIVNEGQTAIRSENRLAGTFLAKQGNTGDEFKTVLQHKAAIWARIDKGWKIYEPLPQTKEEEVLWKQFVKEWEEWKAAESKIDATLNSIMTAGNDDVRSSAKQQYFSALDAAKALFDKSEATLEKIIELNVNVAAEAQKEAESSGRQAMVVMVTTSAIALAALLVLGARTSLGILRTLGGEPDEARAMVQRIANGDLRQNLALKAGDTESLMASQQKMQENLRTMVNEIAITVDRTEQAAQALASASEQEASASEGTSESASSMAASVEEMSVSINQVSDNAREALKTAGRAGQLSVDGGRVIGEAISEINSIASVVRSTAANMTALNESSNQISSIVQVIKDVADQTNLLALNAAIEAARAGEAGRGFAVVADEVRKLAERTAGATTEIGGMIDQIQQQTHASVTTMETAVDQVNHGVELASQAGNAIEEIRESVRQVVDVVNYIGTAIAEQSAASQQIAQRVEQVAQASEENNSAAQQTANAAGELSTLAVQLRNAISRFEV